MEQQQSDTAGSTYTDAKLYDTDGDIDYDKLKWVQLVAEAAIKLVKCKGRYHAELNYKELENVVKQNKKP